MTDVAVSIRQATFEACRWRDMLWESLLDDLESRDPAAARAARAIARSQQVRPLVGISTRAAACAWGHLDYQARADWLWICGAVQQIWIRGALERPELSPGA